MNKEKFLNISLTPKIVSKEDVISLETILEEYPYFQAAQVLHLKGLKLQRSFKYNKTLKKVAAYTVNRTVLFDFITADVLDFDEQSIAEIDLLNNIEVVDVGLIKSVNKISETSRAEEVEFLDNINKAKEEILATDLKKELAQKKDELEIGKPITFTKNDEFSFNQWLELSPKKKMLRDNEAVKSIKSSEKDKKINKSKLKKQVDLIKTFIANKPKIEVSKTQEISDVARESVVENVSIMTETLARVYLEQKKYDKAISAFKILSLKYPKKSSFFADRINAIKFLKKHKS